MLRTSRLFSPLVLAILVLSALAPARAQVLGFGVAFDGNLYSINLTTGTATLIGPTADGTLEGLALSPSNQLFATNSGGQLFSVNQATGLATLIGSTGRGNIEGLDFNG